jgi:hypothetical protein
MWTQTAKNEEFICKEKSVGELTDLCLIIIIILPLLLLLHFWYLCSIFYASDLIVVILRGYSALFIA